MEVPPGATIHAKYYDINCMSLPPLFFTILGSLPVLEIDSETYLQNV